MRHGPADASSEPFETHEYSIATNFHAPELLTVRCRNSTTPARIDVFGEIKRFVCHQSLWSIVAWFYSSYRVLRMIRWFGVVSRPGLEAGMCVRPVGREAVAFVESRGVPAWERTPIPTRHPNFQFQNTLRVLYLRRLRCRVLRLRVGKSFMAHFVGNVAIRHFPNLLDGDLSFGREMAR